CAGSWESRAARRAAAWHMRTAEGTRREESGWRNAWTKLDSGRGAGRFERPILRSSAPDVAKAGSRRQCQAHRGDDGGGPATVGARGEIRRARSRRLSFEAIEHPQGAVRMSNALDTGDDLLPDVAALVKIDGDTIESRFGGQ